MYGPPLNFLRRLELTRVKQKKKKKKEREKRNFQNFIVGIRRGEIKRKRERERERERENMHDRIIVEQFHVLAHNKQMKTGEKCLSFYYMHCRSENKLVLRD